MPEMSINPRRLVQSTQQRRVESFMRAAMQPVRLFPDIPTDDERILRAKLILEEAFETVQALGVVVTDENGDEIGGPYASGYQFNINVASRFSIVEAVDGCCDIMVVTLGTLSTIGVGDVHVMNAVLDANDAKLEGEIREDGKRLKPEGWQPPKIGEELLLQGWSGNENQ